MTKLSKIIRNLAIVTIGSFVGVIVIVLFLALIDWMAAMTGLRAPEALDVFKFLSGIVMLCVWVIAILKEL